MSNPASAPPNPLAIAALVCGLVSVFTSCCCYGMPFNLLGLILGIVAVVTATPESGGKGMAFGGIAASLVSFLIAIGLVVFGMGMGVLSAMLENM
jgi:hypothetical protein